MSVPLEHDYIGLSDASSLERSSESSNISSDNETNNVFNLKATELSLGLPGFSKTCQENATKVGPIIKNFMSGAKRGFSDVNLAGSGKWGLTSGSESDMSKDFNGVFEKNKTSSLDVKPVEDKKKGLVNINGSPPPSSKAQVVGWPPIRSFRKNTMANNSSKNGDVAEGNSGSGGCLFVKVSMDGAPYLRKIDLKTYHNYAELSKALEKMFSCFTLGHCTSNGIKGREGLSESNLKDLLHGSECVLTYEDKDGDWMLVGDVPWEMFIDSCKRLRIMKGSEAIGLAPRSTEKCKNMV
ncbi:putative transcription factor interactor and regulator AUX-IAA family [Helianthus annuus]|nr:putative transcription factor interactor and regulator AUX-IAA family [Helianthus annuus]